MSKVGHKLRFTTLQGWLEQTRKQNKYGKPKQKIDYIDKLMAGEWKKPNY
jgi:hypothetical protein